MKRFRVWDYHEGYGLVGDYDTEKEAKSAAEQHNEDTDGECQIVLYAYRGNQKGYQVVS